MPTELSTISDEALMQKIQQHNDAALTVLVQRHHMRFYRTAYRSLFNQSDAEDALQETFLKLWNKPTLWNPKKNTKFTTWFYRILLNKCFDYNKKKRPLALTQQDEIIDEMTTNSEAADKEQQQQQIERAITALPERQRNALNLCFYEGLSNQDAAEIMGIKLKALQSLLIRAKESLKQQLHIRGEL